MGGRRLALGLATGAVVFATACSGAIAATGFVSPESLGGTGTAQSTVQTAMAPNGFAIAGWVDRVDSTHTAIRVATRPPGGPWSAPQQLDPTSLSQTVYPLSVAIDSTGDAVIAWDDEQTGSPAVDTAMVATKTVAQSSFGAGQSLAGAADPVVGIDAGGHVTMIDGELDGASHDLVDRVWPAGAAAPGTRTDLVATGCRPDVMRSALAVAPSGDAIAAGQCGGDTFIRRISGAWKGPTQLISDASSAGTCPISPPTSSRGEEMTVAIDASGDVAGAFVESNSTTDCTLMFPSTTTTLELVVGSAPGGVTSAGVVDTASSFDFTGGSISGPDIAIVPGKMLLAWRNAGIATTNVQVRPFDAAGNPAGSAQTLVTGTFAPPAQIAMSPGGGALAVFLTSDSTRVQAAVRAPGDGAFSAPTPLAASPSGGPGVAIDDAGDGVAAYALTGTGATGAQARGFDATAPVISSASIPTAATANQPATFSAAATDFWGPVTLSWAFGDGAAATGATVSHAFTTPGAPSVTVTATDAVGNSASHSGAVTVTAAAVATRAPVISNVSETHSTFRVGSAPTPVVARAGKRKRHAPVGTTFVFTLSEAAGVSFRITHGQPGRRSGRSCVKPTKNLRTHRRCTRSVLDGTLRRLGIRGVNRVAFSGRIVHRALHPGTYRVTLTATQLLLTSLPRSLSFRIVR